MPCREAGRAGQGVPAAAGCIMRSAVTSQASRPLQTIMKCQTALPGPWRVTIASMALERHARLVFAALVSGRRCVAAPSAGGLRYMVVVSSRQASSRAGITGDNRCPGAR
jgi:hypothetical protein